MMKIWAIVEGDGDVRYATLRKDDPFLKSHHREMRRHGNDAKIVGPFEHDETDTPKGQTLITIVLRIKGTSSDANDVVERVLDAGTLQEAINEYGRDFGKKVEVAYAGQKP